ncbi:MAG: hypothetical protein ACO3S5_11250 [Ilumatobacteraceae bacterium]
MARWGIAEDGAVLALRGPDALVDEVVRSLSPPVGLEWRGEPTRASPVCTIELVPRVRDGAASGGAVVDHDADGLIGSSALPALPMHGSAIGDRVGVGFDVLVDGERRPGGDAAAESALGLFAAEHLRDLVAVHAAVLMTDAGAVLVAGASHSGKSTLCAAAVDAGVEVWGDEFALLHRDGAVSGWPRPLRLRTASGIVRRPLDGYGMHGAHGEHRTRGDRNRRPLPGPARVALVAALAYSSSGWSVTTSTRAEVVVDLLATAVPAARRPAESFTAAVAVSTCAVGVRGTRGEAAEAVERLRDLTARRG